VIARLETLAPENSGEEKGEGLSFNYFDDF
jgi:hypothetical protein